MMHPCFYLRAILLIYPEHFAQGEQRQFLREQFYKIHNRTFTFQVVQQSIDVLANATADLIHIGWEEEVALLHAHFTMQRLIHIN